MPVPNRKKTFPSKPLLLVILILLLLIDIPVGFSKPSRDHDAADRISVLKYTSLYRKLSLENRGLNLQAFENAICGFQKLQNSGAEIQSDIITIIDFTMSSTQKRLFTIDLQNQQLLFNTYVAHGVNSGLKFAQHFSNRPSSLQSSLGFYQTKETYNGKHGYSLQLKGLESGINDNAGTRAIVIHGAPYVSEDFIRVNGYLGRSWGCPAIPEQYVHPLIDKIKNHTCVYIFANDLNYFSRSTFMKG